MATITHPLLERERELSGLREAIDGAAGGGGGLVVVEGPAGAGKSALVGAAIELAVAGGARVVRAAGSELEREVAFGAVRQLFEPVLAGAPAGERARLLDGAAAAMTQVVERPPLIEATPAQAFAVHHALYWLVANLADERPLLIVVDDLHWVDEASVRGLHYLSRRLGDLPVALLVAQRPDEPGAPSLLLDALRRQAGDAVVALRPLSRVAVSELVRGEIADADDELCGAFHDGSAGNPLYLRELLRAIESDGAQSAETVRAAAIPSLGDRVMRRIALVDARAAALAGAMAVLGDGGTLAVAAAVAGLDEPDASRLAHRLVRIDVLTAEDPFAFVHPLVRRSVYDAQSLAQREAAHARAARELQAADAPIETIAFHLAALRPAGSPDTAATLARAADHALACGAPDAAIRWLRRAVEEQAPTPSRAELLFALGRCEMAVRDPGVVAHLEEAHELAPEPALRARIAAARIELCFASGQWDAGVAMMDAAGDELGVGAPELVLETEAVRAWAAAFDPRLVGAFDDDWPRLAVLARGESWPAAALSGLLAGVAAIRGDGEYDAVALAEQSWRSGALLARGCGGWATAQTLTALVLSEELDRAAHVAEAVEREGRRQGSVIAVLTGAGYRAYAGLRRGELLDTEAQVRTSLRAPTRLAIATGADMWIATGAFLFIDAILERPSLDDMAAGIEAQQIDAGLAATIIGAMLLEARGRVRRRRGDHSGALADLRACAHTNGLLHVGPMHSPWRSELALALPADDQDEAMALIDDELTVARASGYARAVGVALRAAGVRQGGDDGIDVLRESVAVLEDAPARLELARSLVALGAALRRRRLRSDAREPLTRGMELAHRCGATRLVARADEELHAAGARPRRPVQTGADALTASELRVARLAGQDRSNLEIAQELYVSRKTVETHLSHAYSKLGLAGQGARRGLAAALGESV